MFGRRIYEAVVPWWSQVARGEVPDDEIEITPGMADFAEILAGLTKVVLSTTLEPAEDRVVVAGEVARAVRCDSRGIGGGEMKLRKGPLVSE